MPKTDSYGQSVSYPILSDTPNIETAMQSLVNGIVPHTVLRFSNANTRAATFTGLIKFVPGMITYLVAEDRWEGYQADGTWLLLSDGPWQPLTFSTGYIAHAGSPGWRLKAGGGVELRGRIRRSTGNGFIDDGTAVKFAAIPSAYAPASTRYFIVAASRATTSDVTRYTARVEAQPDGSLVYNVESGSASGTSTSPVWFALDGIQFSPAGD